MKVLSKEPSARYRTADQLGRVLLKFGTQPIAPLPAAEVSERPHIRTPGDSPGVESARTRYVPPGPAPSPTGISYESPEPAPASGEIDWISVGLGLLAVLAVGGLIPFWMMIYFVYVPH
jgi:serine/threonine-protein kinase